MRDNNDHAQSVCIDLRSPSSRRIRTDDQERKRSLVKSLMKQSLESPNKDKLMAELFPKDGDK